MKKTFVPREIFDPEKSFYCGQAFVWQRIGSDYAAVVDGNAAYLKRTDGDYALYWEGRADETFWRNYFDLGRDYEEIARRFAGDSAIGGAFGVCEGLRVLNQPVWETIFCFIVSANNNDKRIRLCINRASEALGERREIMGASLFAVPSPPDLIRVGEDGLRALGMGYRAAYLYKTARLIESGAVNIADLREIGYESAVKRLTALSGVGRKVADCVLLFSCGYSGAFPVDTWVDKIMRRLYGFAGGREKLARLGMELYGDDAGIVQQMLFHAARTGALDLSEEEDVV